MWLKLFLLEDYLENNKKRTYLGLEFEGEWYCISHYDTGYGVRIPKRCIKMKVKSKKKEYLKKLRRIPSNIKKETNMAIDESLLVYYEELNIKNINNAYKKRRLREQASGRKDK